jgi:predicted GH43/DUF377 family glycosyl hydrolase
MIKAEMLALAIEPDDCRVLMRSSDLGEDGQLDRLAGRLLSLTEEEVQREASLLRQRFAGRHSRFEEELIQRGESMLDHLPIDSCLSDNRRLLLGSLITDEYTAQSSATFNPSIVPHPDQSNLDGGEKRFVLSVRMTGEGHISSLCFATGVIDGIGDVRLEQPAALMTAPKPEFPEVADRERLIRRLEGDDVDLEFLAALKRHLPESVEPDVLQDVLSELREHGKFPAAQVEGWMGAIRDIMQESYRVTFDQGTRLEERVLFPAIPRERNGIEDVRFTRFVEAGGSEAIYYATYTAYDGRSIFPRLLTTTDFNCFSSDVLYGDEATGKGMALFPRKIGGRYAMLSRQDGENLYLMYSERIDHWDRRERIMRPRYPWELRKVGNCGSPIELPEGWLVLTHGVGPFRMYSIGAILLDLDDPSKIIGRLPMPILSGHDQCHCGYVPNVVYTCGAIAHGGRLIVPFGVSDKRIAFATFDLAEFAAELKRNNPREEIHAAS